MQWVSCNVSWGSDFAADDDMKGSSLHTRPVPDDEVIQAVVQLADQDRGALSLRSVLDAPRHVKALARFSNRALQHLVVAPPTSK